MSNSSLGGVRTVLYVILRTRCGIFGTSFVHYRVFPFVVEASSLPTPVGLAASIKNRHISSPAATPTLSMRPN